MFQSFLKILIQVSEKAANIARTCRNDEHLFALLVEEKTGDDANPRFVNDFKTLADVLIQEMVKHDVIEKFPSFEGHVYGEEGNTFCNSLGEKITVKVFDDIQDTVHLLTTVLNGNEKAAEILSQAVHCEPTIDENISLPDDSIDCDISNLGIVIDPIDATQEYITGKRKDTQYENIPASGLDCVTVLIGVFNMETGVPVAGIINQPFHHRIDDDQGSTRGYGGKVFYGISVGDIKYTNVVAREITPPQSPDAVVERKKRLAILSPSEVPNTIKMLEKLGYEIVYSAGAGHKLLKLITGEVDLYLLSKGTTFKWDTCAPHAILSALGYHLVDLTKSLDTSAACDLTYRLEDGKCNSGGVLGYRNDHEFQMVTKLESANYSMKVFFD